MPALGAVQGTDGVVRPEGGRGGDVERVGDDGVGAVGAVVVVVADGGFEGDEEVGSGRGAGGEEAVDEVPEGGEGVLSRRRVRRVQGSVVLLSARLDVIGTGDPLLPLWPNRRILSPRLPCLSSVVDLAMFVFQYFCSLNNDRCRPEVPRSCLRYLTDTLVLEPSTLFLFATRSSPSPTLSLSLFLSANPRRKAPLKTPFPFPISHGNNTPLSTLFPPNHTRSLIQHPRQLLQPPPPSLISLLFEPHPRQRGCTG